MGGKLSTKRERRRTEKNNKRVKLKSEHHLKKYSSGRTLHDFDLTNKPKEKEDVSLIPIKSSWWIIEEDGEICYDPQDPTLTFVDGPDEFDFLCSDFKSLRAKMSCGHAVTPASLYEWCSRLLEKGDGRFVCGQTDCDVEWPFKEVCKMALLNPEEIESFEKKIFSNAAKNYLDVKQCPGCNSRAMRADFNNLCVECTVCTAASRRSYRFCWKCLREWKGPAPRSDRCDNDGCQNPLELLKTCPDIVFEDVEGVTGCPSIRACPTCGLLLEHNQTKCKNLACPRCKKEFCFVCLKLTDECLELKLLTSDNLELIENDEDVDISIYFKPCSTGVAPRQTTVPVWQRS